MSLDEMFNGKKTFTIISMIVLLVGFIGDFVTGIVWWTRIQPWFSHGNNDGKTVYQCILACWVLSLIGLIALIVFIIFTFFVSSLCDSITGNSVILIVCIAVVGAISVGSIVTGAYGGSFGLKNPNFNEDEDEDEDESNKCAKYLNDGIEGASNWLFSHPDKEDDYIKWYEDLLKHMGENDENDDISFSYLCINVGIPTFVFALVQCVAIILFIVDIILSCSSFARIGQSI